MKSVGLRTRFLSGLAVLTAMLVIFLFSAADGTHSGASSGRIVTLLLRLFVPAFDSMEAGAQTVLYERISFLVRKCGHFTEFTLLGLTLGLHLRLAARHLVPQLPWAWFLGTLYAASDELHQALVPDRGPSVRDVCLDSCGVLFGCLLPAALLWLCQKTKGRK